jgi:hypothetical protein
MFAIIRTRWQTRPLSRRAKRRSSAAPGSLRKSRPASFIPPNMVPLPNHSTTFGDYRKPVSVPRLVENAHGELGDIRGHPPARGSARAEPETATHPNRMGHRLHGMACRAEQIELNGGDSSSTQVRTRDLLGWSSVRDLTASERPLLFGRIELLSRGRGRALNAPSETLCAAD